jgi:hypothetical protein
MLTAGKAVGHASDVIRHHPGRGRRVGRVCRALRNLTPSGKKRALLVPLLRADGATPTFFNDAQWDAYLACIRSTLLREMHKWQLGSLPIRYVPGGT